MTFVIPIGWSSNIGNAFVALGIKYALEQAVRGARVVLLSDQAAYLNLLPVPNYRSEPRNSLRYLQRIRPHYVVLTGSLLTRQFPQVWARSLRSLCEAGTRILLLGVGQYEYNPHEVTLCCRLLRDYPPYALVSRDHQTFVNFRDIARYSHEGIDGAYFIPDIFEPIPTDLPPYIVMNFDKSPEPAVELTGNRSSSRSAFLRKAYRFQFRDREWVVHFPRTRLRLSRLSPIGKGFGFMFGPLGLHGTAQDQVDGFMILRTDHQLNPLIMRRIFRGPNAFAGDIPYTYLNIYAQSRLTLTDRIHAALVTMAYGRPAMLFSQSSRASIIERLGGKGVTSKPTRLDIDLLDSEKQSMIGFLNSVPW